MDDLGGSFYQSAKEKYVINDRKWIKNIDGVNLKSKVRNKIKNSCSSENITRTYKHGPVCGETFIVTKWY